MSKDLMKKYSRRSFPLRKGDSIKVMTGNFRGKTGKIEEVDYKNIKVYIDTISFVKKDGTKSRVPLHPSNLLIQELALDDKKRRHAIERTMQVNKK